MGEVIQLPLGVAGDSIVIEEQEGLEWYGCSLQSGGTRTYLGAENRGYLISHLESVLARSADTNGTIDNDPVRWVLSLAERHSTLYLAEKAPALKRLYLQAADGRTIYTCDLSTSILDQWRVTLTTANDRR